MSKPTNQKSSKRKQHITAGIILLSYFGIFIISATCQTLPPKPLSVSTEIYEKNGATKSYPWIKPRSKGFPVLSSFYFNYTDGDHQMKRVGMDYSEETINNQDVYIWTSYFHDKNGDDPYNTKLHMNYIDWLSDIHINRGNFDDDMTAHLQSIPEGWHLGLIGFSMEIIEPGVDDSEINQIAIKYIKNENIVNTRFTQYPYVSNFNWRLAYIVMPPKAVKGIYTVAGTSTGKSTHMVEPGKHFLQSFDIHFTDNENHHLDQFGIVFSNDEVEVSFNDKYNNDYYYYNINYGVFNTE